MKLLTRRRLIASMGASASGLLLSGCDRIVESPIAAQILGYAETLTLHAQRLIISRTALAREFTPAEMSPTFRTNGNTMPESADYKAHLANGFADWRLVVDGLVRKPLSLSLSQIRAVPARTQITRHDCVEGWSAIGQWTGAPLRLLLDEAGVAPAARFVVFHCADDFDGDAYYESIDLIDAYHPQTILAWGMNGDTLGVGHGAPLRLRVERQLGYKQAKYIMRMELVDSLATIGAGKGGYWEDIAGYQWYAGI